MAAIAALVLVSVSGHLVSRAVGAGLIVGGWLLMLPMSALGPFAAVRCGAHAVPWVERLLGLAPVFFTQVTPRQCPLWVISGHLRAGQPCPLYPQ